MPRTKDNAEQGAAPSITRVGKHKMGYNPQKVDEFLEHAHELYDSPEPRLTQEEIQSASFDFVKNGYSVAEVDAALTRLESAVVDKRTQWDVQHYGRVAWRARTDTLARSLHDRAARPHGERFSDGLPNKPSYDRAQVDHMIDCVIAQIADQLGKTSGIAVEDAPEPKRRRKDPEVWTLSDVANIVFTQRTGHRGYDERQVDAYINRMLQVLARIESFERIEGPIASTDSAQRFVNDSSAEPVDAPASYDTSSPAPSADEPYSADFRTVSAPATVDDQEEVAPTFTPGFDVARAASDRAAAAAAATGTTTAASTRVSDYGAEADYGDRGFDASVSSSAPDASSTVDFDAAGLGTYGAGASSFDTGFDAAPQSFAPRADVHHGDTGRASAAAPSDSPAAASTPAPQPPMSFADAKHTSERGSSSLASLVNGSRDMTGRPRQSAADSDMSVPTGIISSGPIVEPLIPDDGRSDSDASRQ